MSECRPSAPMSRSYTPGRPVVDEARRRRRRPASKPVTLVPKCMLAPTSVARSSEDAGEVGAGHAHAAGYSGPPVLTSGICAMTGASGPGRAQVQALEGVAGRPDVVPHAERVEHAQRVALQRDAGAEGAEVGLRLEDVDVDARLRRAGWRRRVPATPVPAIATLLTAVMSESSSVLVSGSTVRDGDGVDGRADRPGDRQRRRRRAGTRSGRRGAVGGERLEVPHLADRQAHVRDDDLVQRLEGRCVELVRPHLEAPRVGRDRGDLGAVQPAGGGERQARALGPPA